MDEVGRLVLLAAARQRQILLDHLRTVQEQYPGACTRPPRTAQCNVHSLVLHVIGSLVPWIG